MWVCDLEVPPHVGDQEGKYKLADSVGITQKKERESLRVVLHVRIRERGKIKRKGGHGVLLVWLLRISKKKRKKTERMAFGGIPT